MFIITHCTSDSEDSGLAAGRAEERRRRPLLLLGDAVRAERAESCAFRASAAFFSRSRARRSVPGREAFLAACTKNGTQNVRLHGTPTKGKGLYYSNSPKMPQNTLVPSVPLFLFLSNGALSAHQAHQSYNH